MVQNLESLAYLPNRGRISLFDGVRGQPLRNPIYTISGNGRGKRRYIFREKLSPSEGRYADAVSNVEAIDRIS